MIEESSFELAAFAAERVMRLTGLSKRQLQYWDEIGFINPSLTSRKGRGRRRLYAFRDLVSLKVAGALRLQGVSLQRLRRINDHLREMDYRDPFAELHFWAYGEDIYFNEGGVMQDGRRLGQVVISGMAPVGQIASDLRQQIQKDSSDRRKPGLVERRRGVLGNRAVLAGTRITVESIQRLSDDGASPEEILELYPDLTVADVEAALKVDRIKRRTKRAS